MNLCSLQKRSYHFLLGLVLVFALVTTLAENVNAQKVVPKIPVLSLTGSTGGYDVNLYPDGRIWLPPSVDGVREFLLPVFICNRWGYYSENPAYVPADINSFKFKILYDSTAFAAVGYEKDLHPTILPDLPLAHDFAIDFKDEKDKSWEIKSSPEGCTYNKADVGKMTGYYWIRLNPCRAFSDLEKGRVVTISGTSTKALPTTNLSGEDYKVLIYVRFKVLSSADSKTPIVIDDREIRYNDVNIRTTLPFSTRAEDFTLGKTTNNQTEVERDYIIDDNTGIEGMIYTPGDAEAFDASVKGMIWAMVSDKQPRFNMTSKRGGDIKTEQLLVDDIDNPKSWTLKDPISIDTKNTHPTGMASNFILGKRMLKLENDQSNTRMLNIKVESDQPWLQFRRVSATGTNPGDWVTTTDKLSYNDRFKGIDNAILGTKNDPLNAPTKLDDSYGPIYLEFRIDKDKLNEVPYPNKEGLYNGTLSFSSPTAKYSKVQLKIAAILFKDPNEGGTGIGTQSIPGARVWIRNAKSDVLDDTVLLVFGTGPRASAGVDTLYGEFAYNNDIKFDTIHNLAARWFGVSDAQKAAFPNGLGDWLPEDEHRYASSRDIRSEDDTTESLVYHCKFRRNSYSKDVVIEWDPRDFLEGSRCFLRDDVNGSFINLNMREGTVNPLTGRHSYTSTDLNFNSFNIEYTAPKTIKYYDENNEPIIKEGWNMLSLPVRPVNSLTTVIYPNAVGDAYEYNGAGFQQTKNLVVGKGYFMKYAIRLDEQFTGSLIRNIVAPTDQVLLMPDQKESQGAWNLIGGVSTRTSVNDISFTQYFDGKNYLIPSVNYLRKQGVWAYKTGKGYIQVTELIPGLGYFVKVDNYGYLRIIGSSKRMLVEDNSVANNTTINVRDNANNETSIFLAKDRTIDISGLDMPPAFEGMFDVRFTNNYNVSNTDNSVFTLKGVKYPVSITMENADADYTFVDAATKTVIGTIAKGTTSSVVVASARTSAVEIQKAATTTTEVYPNPANDVVSVSFNQATSGTVTMTLVDMFGNKLDSQIATNGTAKFDVSKLSTGKYFCKIVAGDYNETIAVTVVR